MTACLGDATWSPELGMFCSTGRVNDLWLTESTSVSEGDVQCCKNGTPFSPDQLAQAHPEPAACSVEVEQWAVCLTFLGPWWSPSPDDCSPSEISGMASEGCPLSFHPSSPYYTHYWPFHTKLTPSSSHLYTPSLPPTHTVRANSDCPLSSHHKTMDYVNEFSAFFYRVGWPSWLGIIGCAGQCTHSWETHVDRLWPSGLLNWVWRGRNNRSVVDCLISMHMVLSSIFSILIKKKKTSLIKHRLHGSCCDPSTWVSQGSGAWEQTWPIWTSVLRGKQ